MTTPARTSGVIDARRRDSDTKRARVIATLERMQNQDAPITFASVARQATVSTWLVYAPGIRELIGDARDRQRSRRAGTPRGQGLARGLETDLALVRATIRALRAEREQQQQQLRRALGARTDNLARADLPARVEELTHATEELSSVAENYRRDNETLHARVAELEDDLAAARTSLRRMIRAENLPPES